jgi:hypothetical protein
MTRQAVLLMAGLLAASASPAVGQRAAPLFYRWDANARGPAEDTLPPPRRDYRYEGLAFGGLVFGAAGAWLGSRNFEDCVLQPVGDCGDGGNHVVRAVAVGLAGAAVGGGLGYLVGRLSPKKPRPDSTSLDRARLSGIPDSIRVVKGYQHWRGAAIGLAIGAGVGALAAAVVPIDCADCARPSRGSLMLDVGLLGAGAGGVVGFLAGLSSPKYVWVSPNEPVKADRTTTDLPDGSAH